VGGVCNFPVTQSGTGNAGYVFVLDSAQQTAATAAGAFNNVNNLVGLSAAASNAGGGPETFYLVNDLSAVQQSGPPGVPEPTTWLLMSVGLVLIGVGAYRKTA